MTEVFYQAKSHKIDPSTFGGLIFPSDFNTDYRGKNNDHGSPIARRIEQDNRFDMQCRNSLLNKKNMEEQKND